MGVRDVGFRAAVRAWVAFSRSQSRSTLWIGSRRTRVGCLEPQEAKLNIDSIMAVSMTSGSVGKRTRRTSCNTRQPTKEEPARGGGVNLVIFRFDILGTVVIFGRRWATEHSLDLCSISICHEFTTIRQFTHNAFPTRGKHAILASSATPGWVTRAATRSSQITVAFILLASQPARHDPSWQERNRATDVDLRGSSELNGAGPRWAYPSLHHGGSWLHAERTVLC